MRRGRVPPRRIKRRLPADAVDLARRLYDPSWHPSATEQAAALSALEQPRAPLQQSLPLPINRAK